MPDFIRFRLNQMGETSTSTSSSTLTGTADRLGRPVRDTVGSMSYWVILGTGYIGTRLAKALLADGEQVLACARNKERLIALEKAGADTYQFEATRRGAFHYAMGNSRSPIVVYALPPYPGLPGGELVSRAASEALGVGAERFVYLSSTAVYGEGGDNQMVDEETARCQELDDQDARPYVSAEGAVEDARIKGLDSLIFRLSPVYGVNRGVRNKMLKGKYKLLDGGKYLYSRIHIEDVIGLIRAAVARAPANETYCLADDRPCPQREYAEWLSRHLNVRMPTSVPSLAPSMPRRRVRNRGVSNAKIKRDLEYTMLYPSYREGELAIDRELGNETVVDDGPTPLTVHKGAALGDFAKNSRLSKLSLESLALTDDATRVTAKGETVLYVLSGAVEADNSGDAVKLEAGDVVEVPANGLPVKALDKSARALVISTQR